MCPPGGKKPHNHQSSTKTMTGDSNSQQHQGGYSSRDFRNDKNEAAISQRNKTNNNVNDNSEEQQPIYITYSLREHCQKLALKTQTTTSSYNHSNLEETVWYCDLTQPFCPRSYTLLEDVVQDYCQPLSTSLLEDEYIGITNVQSNKIPVRTLSIQLRPDTKETTIWRAVQDGFQAVHPKHSLILQRGGSTSSSSSSSNTSKTSSSSSHSSSFQTIGCDGHLPLWIVVNIVTQKRSPWNRLCLLRVFHAKQCPNLMEEELQKIGGISDQKSLLGDQHTPWNIQLKESSALVQYVLEEQYSPSDPCPQDDAEQTSAYFQNKHKQVPSVVSFMHKQQLQQHHLSSHFPSLSSQDYPLVQESVPLIQRIWSELELSNCTYNTLTRESKRFGMCGQPTLDKQFVQHLAQISQQTMLMSLKQNLEQSSESIHENLESLHQVKEWMIELMKNQYNVDVSDVFEDRLDQDASNSKSSNNHIYGQTPIALPKRDPKEFPWHPSVRQALDNIPHTVAEGCMKDFDPAVSIAMAMDSTYQVMQALGQADDEDQKVFLKKTNRQNMTRLLQQRGPLERLMFQVLPQQCHVACSGSEESLPSAAKKLRHAVQRVQTLSDGKIIDQVPLVECTLPRGGCIIVTPQYLLVNTKPISSSLLSMGRSFSSSLRSIRSTSSSGGNDSNEARTAAQQQQPSGTSCRIIAITDVDIAITPQNLLSKATIQTTKGEVVAKINPTHPVNWDQWIRLIQVLKGLQ